VRRSRLLPVALAAAALVAASAIVLSGSTDRDSGGRGTGPAAPAAPAGLSPAPREMTPRDDGFRLPAAVGVVRDPGVAAATVAALTAALRAAGATDVAVAATDPGRAVTVWLTGAGPVLGRLGVATAEGLPAEGYVLAAGRDGERRHVAVDGVDPAGTFYAVQTLRQLLATGSGGGARAAGGGAVPGVAIRDWPAIGRRGVILGFYGTPWSLRETLDHLDYMAEHKMNSFVYTPKDDPYLRARWRDPLPADRLADLRTIVERATPLHIDVGWILSPGLSICFSAPEDEAAVLAKLDSVYDLGVRTFGIALDDINYTTWHCPQDAAAFAADGVAGGARAQVGLLNRVAAWARGKGDVARVELVPTEYFDLADSPYKTVIRERLDPSVVVMFTGNGVIPKRITVDDVATVRARFGHDILIWDNYPVTDYIPGRLAMGTYSGREPGLSRQVTGILSNPEAHPAVNKISVFTVAAFTWHDDGYDPEASWRAALADRAAGDPETVEALALLADLSAFDGTLHTEPAPRLAQALGEFWQRWRRGDRAGAVDLLRGRAEAIVAAAERLRPAPGSALDPAFGTQAAPWLDAAWRWGRALRAAADVLAAADAEGSEPGYARIDEEVAAAAALRGVRVPHGAVAPLIADWVLDAFLAYVRSGYVTEPPVPVVSLGTYQQNTPAAMVDGDPSTAYSSDGPVTVDDVVGVDLGDVRGIGAVLVRMGTPQSTGDYVRSGVVECSADGVTWTQIGAGSGPLVRAAPPAGTQARYVRLRATADNDNHWVAVREFTVHAPRS
jgi:hyaluronoglucosaminidase